jgi:hypothetical protein
VLRVGVGRVQIGAYDAGLRQPVDGVGAAASATYDLDVGLETLQYLLQLLVLGCEGPDAFRLLLLFVFSCVERVFQEGLHAGASAGFARAST